MRRFILFFAGILMLASCTNENIVSEDIVTASVVAGKVSVCHNGDNEIVISENALETHIAHGDAVDRDGDGFYDKASVCSDEIDCDDTTYSKCNPCNYTPLTDANIKTAVALWLSDQAAAEAAYGDIECWDTSNVTDMAQLFSGASSFNQDISGWDVGNVTTMYYMFAFTSFNRPIGNWNVSKVTRMSHMFEGASSFNQDISVWNVSNVTDMASMFNRASSFNQPIGNWNVSNVKFMNSMFRNAIAFNQGISSWDVSSVTNMNQMFYGASSFNQDLSGWCVTNITSSSYHYYLFDKDAASWTEPRPVWGTCPTN